MRLPRRGALALPLLTLPLLVLPRALPAALTPPPFPGWVGRTARLRAPAAAAKLLLAPDGSGAMSLKMLFLCRQVRVLSWRMDDPRHLSYRRLSVLDPNRVVEGEALIEGAGLRWIEAQAHEAEFEGFEAPEAARSCG